MIVSAKDLFALETICNLGSSWLAAPTSRSGRGALLYCPQSEARSVAHEVFSRDKRYMTDTRLE
jgi:hypothetical protein